MDIKTFTKDELDEILRKHALWLINDPNGSRADLYEANLIGANLYGADLYEANLIGANLYGVNLIGANLYGVNLCGADLSGADLRIANLCGVNLYGADLYEANLIGANLCGANLIGANLYGANLYEADLIGADIRRANLCGADLREVKNLNCPTSCPEEGSFIGFKKVRENYIVKLEIPEDALRCSATGRKCRCSKAKVVSITNIDGTKTDVTEVFSKYDPEFVYRVGEIVSVDNFEPDRWKGCAPGIHFFITRQEAVDY